MSLTNLWILSFVIKFSFFFATVLLSWVAVRSFGSRGIWRSILFNSGLLMVSANYLLYSYWGRGNISLVSIAPFVAGFTFIGISLAMKKWQYIFGLGTMTPFIISSSSRLYVLSLLPALALVYLAYSNYCRVNCSGGVCASRTSNKQEGREWALIILLLVTSLGFEVLSYSSFQLVCQSLAILALLGAVMLIYMHILSCINFTKQERLLLPLMTAFILIILSLGFLTTLQVSSYNQKITEANEREKVAATLVAAETVYPNGELTQMIEAKDTALNNFVDSFYVRTGIVATFFLGNERVASAPSKSGSGRLIGTTIEDKSVKDKVLSGGQVYSGNIVKAGTTAIAAYAPIYDGDRVIGMVGTGTFLTDIDKLQNQLFFRTIAGAIVVMSLVLGATFLKLPRKKA